MPRSLFADPKTDFAFARIFGSEEHEGVLIAFLDAMLELDGPRRITTVELIPPRPPPPIEGLRISTIAVECTDASGDTSIVELQLVRAAGLDEPTTRDAVAIYRNVLAGNQLQRALGRIVGITIADLPLWPDDERERPMLTRWGLVEKHTGTSMGLPQLVLLELPKYDASHPPRTAVEKWACFFREADTWTSVPEARAEPPFVDALQAARTAGFTPAEWEAYALETATIQDERSP